MMSAHHADVLAAAASSGQLVGAHDRSGWIALFGPNGRVEDPVGSRPHVGPAKIGRFYDTFIGPRDIVFATDADYVKGTTVVRDLTLQVAMGGGVRMEIPAVLRYELTAGDDGELSIAGLHAYWELPAMVVQFARNGAPALGAGIGLARAMLVHQGIGGALGFARGFHRPGARARTAVADLVHALSVNDQLAIRRALARAVVDPDLKTMGDRLSGVRAVKTLVAGRSVAVSLSDPDARSRGVLIADVGSGAVIRRVRFFD